MTIKTRSDVLDEADHLINGDRNVTYGTPVQNFTNISEFFTTFLHPKLKEGEEITPEDVALLMVLVKVARNMNNNKMDNAIDGAGYFAILGELIATRSK